MNFVTRVVVSGLCLIVLVCYKIWPSYVDIDPTTMVLLALIAIPWLLPNLKSIEFPGGLKITLGELQDATRKVVGKNNLSPSLKAATGDGEEPEPLPRPDVAQQTESLAVPAQPESVTSSMRHEDSQVIGDWSFQTTTDPRLAIVGLRIEIERRLRALADKHHLVSEHRLSRLIERLRANKIIDKEMSAGLVKLILLANAAVHVGMIDEDVLAWARADGPRILSSLDALLLA